jgi:hypothetical protein
MIFIAETKPSDDLIPVSTIDVENPQDFNTTYKDWQAVRIIRDNFFDGWRMFFVFLLAWSHHGRRLRVRNSK